MSLIFPDGSYTTNSLPGRTLGNEYMVTDYVPGYGLPSQPSPPPPITESAVEIANAYQQLFGRAADDAGAQYWAGTGLTGQELINAMGAGAQGADIQAYQAYAQKAPAAGMGVGIATLQQPEKIVEAQAAAPAPMTIGMPDTVTNYGNVKFTTAKQDKASDFAEKYLGTSELTPEQLSFISQNYTGTNLENTVKLLAEQEKTKQAYQSALGRDPTAEELATSTKKYNWKNIGEGITSNIGSQVITGDPTIDYVINQAYKTQLGREGDEAGVNYWKGELAKGNITLNQFKDMFGAAAEEDLIKQGYKDIFGREADVEGLKYYKDTLNTTSKDEIYNALKTGAKGTDLLALTNYLNSQGVTDTKPYVDKYLAAENDILNEYESFRKYGIDPTLAGDNYFGDVSTSYGNYSDNTINDIFGSNAANQMSAETKQNIINNLLSGKVTREELRDTFQNSGSNKAQEASRIANLYAQAFGGSDEDAKALYAELTGQPYSGTGVVDSTVLSMAQDAFKNALTSEKASDTELTKLVHIAANKEGAQNRKFFQDNPDAYTTYKDIGALKAIDRNASFTGSGYGLVNDMPVIADEQFQKIKEQRGNNAMGFAHSKLDDNLGWNLSGASGFIKTGAALAGVEYVPPSYDSETGAQVGSHSYNVDVKDDIQAIKDDTKLTKEEKSAKIKLINQDKLKYIAEKNGIDTSGFKDTYKTVETTDPESGYVYTTQVLDKSADDQIYDALNKKYENVAFIGGAKPGATDKSKRFNEKELSGLTDDQKKLYGVAEDSDKDFLATMYQKVGDKWVALSPDKYKPIEYAGILNPDVYKKKGIFGGFLGDVFQGIASIPGIAELAFAASGGNPAVYAAAKAGQTAAFSTDIGDIAKAGAKGYLAGAGSQMVSPEISKFLSNAGITGTPNQLLTSVGTGATIGGTMAGLSDKSIGQGILTGGTMGGLGYGIDSLVSGPGIDMAKDLGITDPAQQKIFANTLKTLAPTILTGGKIDPTKLLMSYAMSQARGKAKETARGAA